MTSKPPADAQLPWTVAAPDVAGLAPGNPPDADQPDDIEVNGAVWEQRRLVAVELDRPDVADLLATGCDFSGVVTSAATLRRLALAGSRLRDCTFAGGMVQDATLDGCTGERLSVRFSTLQRVVVTGSSLPGLDLYGATLDRVLFRDCDLSGAVFDGVTVKDLRLERCVLTNVTGALSLRGARVDLDDLPSLAPSLAREVGIVLS